jgi:peptide/nickel transport system substrate-binding protein
MPSTLTTQSLKLTLSASAIAFALGASAGDVRADKASDTLKVAFTKELESVDGYFNSAREGVHLLNSIWDGLLYRDTATGEYKGNLATSWTWIDDTTLEFKLREEVKFHNGEPFDADDVVYTINFVADPKNAVVTQSNVNWLKEARKVDQHTVQIITKQPFPTALEYLAGPVSIYPDEYYAKAGPAGMALKPIGTGPYAVESVEPGKHFVLKKYDGYHDSPKGKATIDKIDIRTIPDVNTQLLEMMSGGIDILWGVPADQAEKLATMDRYKVVSESSMRLGYLELDAAGRSGAGPLTKLAVRRAINHAIDRQAIVSNLLKGNSKVVNTACYPTQFGCEQDVTAYDYDPKKAKALLAEAGYPQGVTIDFYAYRDRELAEAIGSYLSQAGIKVNFKFLQYSALHDLRAKGQTPIAFQTWGSYSVNDASAITSLFFKHGELDFARDYEVKGWLDTADSSIDPAKRREFYGKALKKIADQAYWAPLFSYNVNYVFTKDMSYTPAPDETVRFFQMSWR